MLEAGLFKCLGQSVLVRLPWLLLGHINLLRERGYFDIQAAHCSLRLRRTLCQVVSLRLFLRSSTRQPIELALAVARVLITLSAGAACASLRHSCCSGSGRRARVADAPELRGPTERGRHSQKEAIARTLLPYNCCILALASTKYRF